MTKEQQKIIDNYKKAPTTFPRAEALKRAILGLEEIEILSRHPNSDRRVNDWALLTLGNIADALN